MIGYIVKHGEFGLGRIRAVENRRVTVEFFSPAKTATLASGIERAFLSLGSVCDGPEGRCRIKEWSKEPTARDARTYVVEYDSGLTARVSESDLSLIELARAFDPLQALCQLELEGYSLFRKREDLTDALGHVIRGGLGVRALLSSRIDLKPHQAYVAGTVLLDTQQRYILADEVGLGKTIEAGIVVHDILGRKPDAKILVLCPGALARQWLCELYSKFSGHVFSMPELHSSSVTPPRGPRKEIISFARAMKLAPDLLRTQWDLVVIDEVHHLLSIASLYNMAKRVSEVCRGLLLLSALPGVHREDDYLRLLALLEPDRYSPDDDSAREQFKKLYERQVEIGRKLGYVSRRLEDFVKGLDVPDKVVLKLEELAALPVLAGDETLATMVRRLRPSEVSFAHEVRTAMHHVGDHYRINRHVLRNRRRRLAEDEPTLRAERRLAKIAFCPEQLELDSRISVHRLLRSLKQNGVQDSLLLPLARQVLQSSCDPTSLLSVLQLAESSTTARPALSMVSFDSLLSYEQWQGYMRMLWAAIGPDVSREEVRHARKTATEWREGMPRTQRLDTLVRLLRTRHEESPLCKFLVFAGFPGLGERISADLREIFSSNAVARFNFQMDDDRKEKEVRRFRRDRECWILVSDESGGEGRNFQFADELVHFDLPWYAGRVEQRIGRLDRLGREKSEVLSNVLVAIDQEEDGLLTSLERGFQVFSESISGLEFALRDLENQIVAAAIDDGRDGIVSLIDTIKARSEQERAEDESQELLDEASLERAGAEAFKRAQSTPERDIQLEQAFAAFFSAVTSRDGVRFVREGDYTEGIVEFRPDQGLTLELNLRRGENGAYGDRRGTFRRALAQERPDLEFFSVGNELFDAVCTSLQRSIKGRSYAVECMATHQPWRGFEFGYRAVGKRGLLSERSGLLNNLDRVFSVRHQHSFVSDDLSVVDDPASLLSLRRSLKPEQQDRTWWNYTSKNGRAQVLSQHYSQPGWGHLIRQVEPRARELSRIRFKEFLSPLLETERLRVHEQIRQAEIVKFEGWRSEIEAFELFLDAIGHWDLELEIVGFFSVNRRFLE